MHVSILSHPKALALAFLVLLLAVLIVACKQAPPPKVLPLSEADWESYKSRFVTPIGRVMDTGNKGISHSEGQGYAMLFAHAQNDQKTFNRIWRWTRENMQVREEDKLLSWRWTPGGTGGGEITDPNNATDGELLVAWALIRAGEDWGNSRYLDQAREILEDVRKYLVYETEHGPVLLPGKHGFTSPKGVTVNPSYWVFPAMEAFKHFDDEAVWDALIQTGFKLLKVGGLGSWRLPPDWLLLTPDPVLPDGFDPYFGYNAVRVPLYLVWAGQGGIHLQNYAKLWSQYQPFQIPAFVNLKNDSMAEYAMSKGMKTVSALTLDTLEHNPQNPLVFPPLNVNDDYYSSSLLLLARLAAVEGRER